VLEMGEEVLVRNPWDVSAQLAMAEAAGGLGLWDMAVWTLEQARQRDPTDITVNKALANLYEQRGNFTQAITLWEMIRKKDPKDVEAQRKGKDLAASDTIARGRYQEVINTALSSQPEEESSEVVAGAAEAEGHEESEPTAARKPNTPLPIVDRLAREATPLL